ncbi:UNVERIFIED_CONTAM: hypothetical protein FKN15_004471 [Acipenser sinensis]
MLPPSLTSSYKRVTPHEAMLPPSLTSSYKRVTLHETMLPPSLTSSYKRVTLHETMLPPSLTSSYKRVTLHETMLPPSLTSSYKRVTLHETMLPPSLTSSYKRVTLHETMLPPSLTSSYKRVTLHETMLPPSLTSSYKRSDQRPLAQFYHADEEVTRVTAELNGVDLRKDLQKYLVLLNQLRISQDRMLRTIELVMEECIPAERQSRDYHIKFPDEILHDNLRVQLWFAAECLSAGSFLEVRESEGVLLRPLAEELLHCLEGLRLLLREHSLSDSRSYPPLVKEALLQYDRVFSEFELSYISTVIPVKSLEEMQRQQEIVVLFCETVDRALKLGYLTQELIDGCDPLLMFTIPRLAIIWDLLCILTAEELDILEMNLCTAESGGFLCQQERSPPSTGSGGSPYPDELPPADYEPEPGKLEAHRAHRAPEPLQDLYTASSTIATASSSSSSSQHREDGPLNLQHGPESMSGLFRPFYTLLQKIRDLLCILTAEELDILEMNLCTAESGGFLCQQERSPPSTGSGGSPYPDELPPPDYEPEPGKLEAHRAHRAPEPLQDLYTASSTVATASSSSSSSQHREGAGFSPIHPTQEAAPEHVIPQNSHPHPAAPGGRDWGFSGSPFPYQSSAFQQSELQATAEHGHPVEDCRTALGTGEQIRNVNELLGSDRDRSYRSYSVTVYNRAPARTEAEGRERDSTPLVMSHSGVPGQQLRTTETRQPSRDSSRRRSGQESYHDLAKIRRAVEDARLRARYRSNRDMIHRLFVCISGVADQLQTNFASDMRTILKSVFEVTASSADPWADSAEIDCECARLVFKAVSKTAVEVEEEDSSVSRQECELCEELNDSNVGNAAESPGEWEDESNAAFGMPCVVGPPVWVPDSACNRCSACEIPFTLLRRRHHCRSCGKIFCARCSPHETPIPASDS